MNETPTLLLVVDGEGRWILHSFTAASCAAVVVARLNGIIWTMPSKENISRMSSRTAVTLTVATITAAMSGMKHVEGK